MNDDDDDDDDDDDHYHRPKGFAIMSSAALRCLNDTVPELKTFPRGGCRLRRADSARMNFIFGVTPRASAWLGSAHAL